MGRHLRVVQQLTDDQPVLYSAFGIVGDGKTYDDNGVASLMQAVDDHGRVDLEGAPAMLLGQTVRFSQRKGAQLTTGGREPNADQRNDSHRDASNRALTPWFLWGGDKGGDMFYFDRCKRPMLDGFVFQTDDFFREHAPAGRAIVLDGGPDTAGDDFGTSATLSNLRHVTYPEPGMSEPRSRSRGPLANNHYLRNDTRPRTGLASVDVEADFITIAQDTKWNQEFHAILACGGNGNGRGRFLHQGPSYNAKNTRLAFTRYADAYARAVQCDNGSLKMEHNNMSLNDWDLFLLSSTGYYTEVGHIGEGSTHHAFINAAFYAYDGTYDNSRTRERSLLISDPLFPITHPDHRDREECWILIGPMAGDVELRHCAIGSPPSPETRVFGWMNDGSQRRTELGPFWFGYGHTRRTVGIDYETLNGSGNASQQAGTVIFHDRGHESNPNGGGVLDLPSGELRFNERGVNTERSSNVGPVTPTGHKVAESMPDWSQIAFGETVFYNSAAQLQYRQVRLDGSRWQGTVGASKPVKS